MTPKSLLIQWNNKRPLDYLYRKKHNIAFNSPEHRRLSQIDIYLDWLEEQLYKEAEQQWKDETMREKEFKEKGIWLREAVIEVSDEWFDRIDIEDMSSQIKIDD